MSEGPTTIRIDLSANPFYAGVSAAADARTHFEELPKDVDYYDRMALFWLEIGTHMQKLGLDDEEAQALFMQGVMTRAPQRPRSVIVQFATSNAAFHTQDEGDESFDTWRDDDDRNAEAARILRQVAQEVAVGSEKGSIRDINGNRVGKYRVD